MRNQHVVGVTSNPTIFAKALSDSDDYADQVRDLAARKVDVEEALRMITTHDVRWACDVMRPAYDASGTVDGRVSIEVDPRLAMDTEPTIAEAKQLWWLVDRENLYIKIPATAPSVPAITATLAEGISVNVTLIFSLDRYSEVMDAYMTGLEQAGAAGHDLSAIRSVASFFVSRVDTEVDKRLEGIGGEQARSLCGRARVANARLAYQRFRTVLSTGRWQRLAVGDAWPQRPLWASTGVKNPAYPDTLYVDGLVATDTVSTMPEATLRAVANHGQVSPDAVSGAYDDAAHVLAALAAAGIDYDDVVQTLEREGISKFADAWSRLLDQLRSVLAKGDIS
jgi:transaldolase